MVLLEVALQLYKTITQMADLCSRADIRPLSALSKQNCDKSLASKLLAFS